MNASVRFSAKREKTMTTATASETQPAADKTQPIVTLPLRFRYRQAGAETWYWGCAFPSSGEVNELPWCVVASVDSQLRHWFADDPSVCAWSQIPMVSEIKWIDTIESK